MFDGKLQLDKLAHLRSLLDTARDEDQDRWCRCFFHQIANDPTFIAAGLDISEEGKLGIDYVNWPDINAALKFFGAPPVTDVLEYGRCFSYLFDSHSVEDKKDFLDRYRAEAESSAT